MGSWIAPHKIAIEPCQVYGAIYFSDKAAVADFVVFEESQETFADLVIFKESNFGYADEIGKWYEVGDPILADYIIYVSKNISESDFTIAYTDIESFSGCNE